jgi:hypothetical protein
MRPQRSVAPLSGAGSYGRTSQDTRVYYTCKTCAYDSRDAPIHAVSR